MARANRSIVNSKPKPFLSTWKTDNLSAGSSAANQIRIPVNPSGSYNFIVYWGDGTSSTITSSLQSDLTHSYASAGTYNVTMSGYIDNIRFANGGDKLKILDISQWGSIRIAGGGSQFYGCSNLTLNNISDTPNLYSKNLANPTLSASISTMFRSCSLLTTISRLDQWDTSKVGYMGVTFYNNDKFNQNIGNWNTNQVSDMQFTFAVPAPYTSSFNNGGSPSINNWDTSNVNNMYAMFSQANSFNQNIGSWNTSKVTNMAYMFQARSFNNGGSPDINNWDVSKVTNMSRMFQGAFNFNQPLNNWKIPLVTDMLNFMYEGESTPYAFSVTNYSNFLIALAAQPVKPNVSLRVNQYYDSTALAARAVLAAAPNNWTFVDRGLQP
jgi:surface protein